MIQQKTLEKYFQLSKEIARDAGVKPDQVKKVMEALEKHIAKSRRQPAPPPPPGGISQSAGARLHKIHQRTISRWAERKILPVLLRTNKEVYVNEAILSKLVDLYKISPGRGKKTIRKALKRQVR